MANKQSILERGAEILLMDFSLIAEQSFFAPNQSFQIDVAFEPYIKNGFWLDFQMCCLIPPIYLIYKLVNCFVAHHKSVKSFSSDPPNRCESLNQRMFG